MSFQLFNSCNNSSNLEMMQRLKIKTTENIYCRKDLVYMKIKNFNKETSTERKHVSLNLWHRICLNAQKKNPI